MAEPLRPLRTGRAGGVHLAKHKKANRDSGALFYLSCVRIAPWCGSVLRRLADLEAGDLREITQITDQIRRASQLEPFADGVRSRVASLQQEQLRVAGVAQ